MKTTLSESFFFLTSKAWDISDSIGNSEQVGCSGRQAKMKEDKEQCQDGSLCSMDSESKQIREVTVDESQWEGMGGCKVSLRSNYSRSWLWPGHH